MPDARHPAAGRPVARRGVRVARLAAAFMATAMAAGCSAWPPAPTPWADPPRLLVFGEQHDQPDQQRQVADAVQSLAARGRLAAVVIEMADQGRDTALLPRDADEAQVRDALGWTGWPWEAYAGIVMHAVRAGVPVHGGNLPRARTRPTMDDGTYDGRVSDEVRLRLLAAVREGHCGMLPPAREPGMLRVQVARDLAMADTVRRLLAGAAPGRVVLLHTGMQHASRDRGVPWHLVARGEVPPADIRVVGFGGVAGSAGLALDSELPAAHQPRPDPCEGLREKLAPPAR